MFENIAFILIERVAIITMTIYIIFTFSFSQRHLIIRSKPQSTIFIGILGGVLGIIGTFLGIEYKTAITNYRDMGVIIAAVIGGPISGTISGLIAGLHRMTLGGVTGISCSLATIMVGVLTGFSRKLFGPKLLRPQFVVPLTIGMEFLHLGFVYLVTFPKDIAADIVTTVLLPMVLGNSIGVLLLSLIFRNLQIEKENVTEETTQSIFKIVENTIGLIDKGLNETTARQICETIKKLTSFDAVALTTREKILSHVGAGEDHHTPGNPNLTESTRLTIQKGKARLIKHRSGIGCSHKNCPLFRGILIPIKFTNGETIGTLKLYKTKENDIEKYEITFAKGLGQILSLELELSKTSKEARDNAEARYRQLVAKTDPHFLFNILNALAYLTRHDSEKAREMILKLSEMMRYTLREKRTFVPLDDELSFVRNYLQLMKIRFGELLDFKIEKDLKEPFWIPPFTIQPIVENSIKHGMIPNKKLFVRISVKVKSRNVEILIFDTGKGIENENKLQTGIGLKLIRERLSNLYGEKAHLEVNSKPMKGTTITIRIPESLAKKKVSEIS